MTTEPQAVDDFGQINSMTLDEVQALQQHVDELIWTGPQEKVAKRRHILLHLMILAAKLARFEERRDHDVELQDPIEECGADLLVYAAQLAELADASLADLYERRLRENLQRLPGRRP